MKYRIYITPTKWGDNRYKAIIFKDDILKECVYFGNKKCYYYIDDFDDFDKEKCKQEYIKSQEYDFIFQMKHKAFYERWILWNKKTIDESIEYLNNKYSDSEFLYCKN